MIPQTNPKLDYLDNKENIDSAIQQVLDSGWYILGKEVETFEKNFSSFIGSKHSLGVASGTDAIEIALRALDIQSGDLVFTVSHTAVATIAAIERCGATPVLIDIDKKSYTLNPELLEATIKKSKGGTPKAIIPVHIYGHPADMASIMTIAKRHNLNVVEDCAQAHGASLNGQKVGTFGDFGVFSFYPTKNLGAIGDGGAVTTNNPDVYDHVKALRQYGWEIRTESSFSGINSRLDELQAAILNVKLKKLEENNNKRRAIADAYTKCLKLQELVLPNEGADTHHVYHQYAVQHPERDKLKIFLQENDIQTSVHYPIPVHLQKAYKNNIAIGEGGLEATETLCTHILSLPMFPQLTSEQIDKVVQSFNKF